MFGEIVRSHRRRLGLSQEELAEQVGVSVRAIGKIESGRTAAPRPFTLRLLADAFALTGADRDRFIESADGDGPPQAESAIGPPAQLPASPAGFVGRSGPLDQLDQLLATRGSRLAAIIGTAGVGKTSAAVHWAHRVRDRFPDGQLYVNLRGFDPSGKPVDAAEALRGFLEALGVEGNRVPADRDARAALFRTLATDRRLLVLLDNAADAQQVEPLLPAAAGCFALVTSRHQLVGLVTREGAQPLTLDVLAPDEARELLTRRLGAERLDVDPWAVEEIVARTARLPLALAIVAARAATCPELPLRALAEELDDRSDHRDGSSPASEAAGEARLDALTGGDSGSDIRAVFSWSYRALSPPAARLFRLLGLHPGPALSIGAAASLAGEPVATVRPWLAELVRAHLITEQPPGRYGFHDLLRAYAMHLSSTVDIEADRWTARHRMFDHYLHGAYAANVALDSQRHRFAAPPTVAGAWLEAPADRAEATEWFAREYPVVRAAVDQAARTGFDRHAWQLAWTMVTTADRAGHWRGLLRTLTIALAAAERIDDIEGQTYSLRNMAKALVRSNQPDAAEERLRRALDLATAAGDEVAIGRIHIALADVEVERGHNLEALAHNQRALDQFTRVGLRHGRSTALFNLGWVHALLGDYQRAIADLDEALTLRAEDDFEGQAAGWHSLGYAHHHLGHYPEAIACYWRSIDNCREAGIPVYEALALSDLGETYLASGEPGLARLQWQYAVTALDKLQHPAAAGVRARLAATDEIMSGV